MADDLTVITGVGDSTEEQLNELGFDTFDLLAEANPSVLADELDYMSEDKALQIVGNASERADPERPEVDTDEEGVLGPMATDDSPEDDEDDDEEAEDDEESNDDDESGGDDVTDDTPDQYQLNISGNGEVETEFVTAVTEGRRNYHRRNPNRFEVCETILDQYRETGLEMSLTEFELDTLHSILQQRKQTYRGSNQIEKANVLSDLREQVATVREQYR